MPRFTTIVSPSEAPSIAALSALKLPSCAKISKETDAGSDVLPLSLAIVTVQT